MPASPRGEIEALLRQGRQMDAIKQLRRTEGLGQAKNLVEAMTTETR